MPGNCKSIACIGAVLEVQGLCSASKKLFGCNISPICFCENLKLKKWQLQEALASIIRTVLWRTTSSYFYHPDVAVAWLDWLVEPYVNSDLGISDGAKNYFANAAVNNGMPTAIVTATSVSTILTAWTTTYSQSHSLNFYPCPGWGFFDY